MYAGDMALTRAERWRWPAEVTGLANKRRIEYLRETFPYLPWVEVYAGDDRPDRTGGVTDRMISDARKIGVGGSMEAIRLNLLREFHMVRWREWLESTYPEESSCWASVNHRVALAKQRRKTAAEDPAIQARDAARKVDLRARRMVSSAEARTYEDRHAHLNRHGYRVFPWRKGWVIGGPRAVEMACWEAFQP